MTTESDVLIDLALARHVLFGAITTAFSYPTEEQIKLLRAEASQRALYAAAALIEEQDGGSAVPSAIRSFLATPIPEVESLLGEYHRLLGHTTRGVICAFETEYGAEGLFAQPNELANIAGFYAAFGLKTRIDAAERVDHIGCECEFMAFLSLKEALALETSDTTVLWSDEDRADVLAETRKAQRRFLREHVGRFGIALGRSMIQADPKGFYGRVGGLLILLLEAEAARHHIPAGPATLVLRSTSLDDAPLACAGPPQLQPDHGPICP